MAVVQLCCDVHAVASKARLWPIVLIRGRIPYVCNQLLQPLAHEVQQTTSGQVLPLVQ